MAIHGQSSDDDSKTASRSSKKEMAMNDGRASAFLQPTEESQHVQVLQPPLNTSFPPYLNLDE